MAVRWVVEIDDDLDQCSAEVNHEELKGEGKSDTWTRVPRESVTRNEREKGGRGSDQLSEVQEELESTIQVWLVASNNESHDYLRSLG